MPSEPEPAGDLFLHILVAEDSPIIARLISALLAKRSYTAEIVVDGHEAVAAVVANDYDLVLMDVQMPDMDGIAATKAIRALQGPKRDVPIVALTANAFVGQRETYLAAGMDDYVTKPIQPDALYEAILRLGRGQSDARRERTGGRPATKLRECDRRSKSGLFGGIT